MNIGNALAAGYTIAQTLGFITGNYPNIGRRIKEAQKLGYDVEKIIKSFSNMTPEDLESYENSYTFKSKNPWIDSDKLQRDRSAMKTISKAGKIAGATVIPLAAYGAYRALRPAIAQMGQQLGSNPQPNAPTGGMPPGPNSPGVQVLPTNTPNPGQPINPPPNAPQTPGQIATPQTPMPQGMTPGQQIAQGVQNPVNQAMQPQGADEISQAASAMPDVQQQQQPSLFDQLTQGVDINTLSKGQQDQLAFLGMITDKLQSEGKNLQDPEVKKVAKKIQNTLAGKPGTFLEEISRGATEQALSPVQQEKPVIEKSSIVNTPSGVGEVKAISNGQAIVEIDGKAHKIKEDEIEPPLYTDDDVADAYDRIMEVIPEQHRSGFIQWAGYDEDRNTLGFIPRGGKYEELTDITPEEAKMIKEGKGIARTTGEKREGLWVAGEDTRGGIISQIIWDRKKAKDKKESDEYALATGLPFQKEKNKEKVDKGMKPIFDEMGYARAKSQERGKAKKLAEKERKKKEKDEAKKRKK